MRRLRQALPAIILLAALIGIWELYVDLHDATFSLAAPSIRCWSPPRPCRS